MNKILNARLVSGLRRWLTQLIATDGPADPLAHFTLTELADLPVSHPRRDDTR